MDAHERFDKIDAKTREVHLGRSPYRVPRALGGWLTLGRLRKECRDPRVHPNSGWLITHGEIGAYVAGLPEELRLERRQLYNTLYREKFLIRVGGRGGVVITHENSVYAYLGSHHAHAAEAHQQAGRGLITNCTPGSVR